METPMRVAEERITARAAYPSYSKNVEKTNNRRSQEQVPPSTNLGLDPRNGYPTSVEHVSPLVRTLLSNYKDFLKRNNVENPQKFLEDLLARLDKIVALGDDLLPDENSSVWKSEQKEKQEEALIGYMFAVKQNYNLSFDQQLSYLEDNYIPQEEYSQKFLAADLEIRYGMPVGQLKEHTAEILAQQPITYSIKKGDTLHGIINMLEKERGWEISKGAKRQRIIDQICALNSLESPHKIEAGKQLQLPPLSTAEIKNKGLSALFSDEDLARIKLELDLPELPPVINELLEILSGVILLNYSPEMTGILSPKELVMQTIFNYNNISKNLDKIKKLIASSNDPELSAGQRSQRMGSIIRNICEVGNAFENEKKEDIKATFAEVVTNEITNQKNEKVTEAMKKAEVAGNKSALDSIDEISIEADGYIAIHKRALIDGDTVAANKALQDYKNCLAKLKNIAIPADTSPEEREKIVQKVQDTVKKGLDAGLLTAAEAGSILAGIFANLLYASGLAAEYVNFVTLDSQVQANAARYDENCLVYMKKLLADASYISQFIAEKNAAEERETKLEEKRKELASLNIPKGVRNLISQIYGIDFENIDGAVARAIAEKVSNNEKIKLG